MENNSPAPEVMADEAPHMNFGQRFSGIYFEPAKTFADISWRPTWLAMFLVAAVLMLALGYVSSTRMDPEVVIRKALDASPFQLSEEQKEQAVRDGLTRQQNPVYKYGMQLVSPAFSLVLYCIIAGIFLLLFVLMGAPLTFKRSLGVTIWGMSPPAIIQYILSIILMYIKDPNTIDFTQGVLMSNLGGLVDSKAHPILASLFSSIDLFSFWSIALLAIGFAAMSERKLTTKKAAVGVVIIWVIYVLGKLGIRAIFS